MTYIYIIYIKAIRFYSEENLLQSDIEATFFYQSCFFKKILIKIYLGAIFINLETNLFMIFQKLK